MGRPRRHDPIHPALLLVLLAILVVPTGCLDAPEARSVNGSSTWDPSDFPIVQNDDTVNSGDGLELLPQTDASPTLTNCGDGQCEEGESSASCPIDCGSLCGDGICNGGEAGANCPQDCGALCGDGGCSDGENTATCPTDCGSLCGDGTCNGGESNIGCAQDCGAICGDGACNGIEGTINCPTDCGSSCGDGTCNGDESSVNCAGDCDATCGDGACNGGEGTTNCAADCGSSCGDGACNGGESSGNCISDCGAICGDGTCNGDESQTSCSEDCGSLAPPDASLGLNGYIGGVVNSDGGKAVQGWACQLGWEGSIDVHLYVGGSAGVGTILKGATANLSSEPAVGAACQTSQGAHRFMIPLTSAELNTYAGQAVYVHGISPVNGPNSLLTKSGDHTIPGSGGGGVGGGGGGENVGDDVSAPPLSQVTWLHTNVSGWPVTANLSSVTVQGGTICMEYDKKNSWPSVAIPHSSGNGNVDVVANPWVIAQFNGQWYAATWEWLAVGTTCRNKAAVAGDHIKQAPLGPANWTPTSGETLFFMVSGLARIPGIVNVSERSNLVKMVWP